MTFRDRAWLKEVATWCLLIAVAEFAGIGCCPDRSNIFSRQIPTEAGGSFAAGEVFVFDCSPNIQTSSSRLVSVVFFGGNLLRICGVVSSFQVGLSLVGEFIESQEVQNPAIY